MTFAYLNYNPTVKSPAHRTAVFLLPAVLRNPYEAPTRALQSETTNPFSHKGNGFITEVIYQRQLPNLSGYPSSWIFR